jgi:hypothetical protein
VTSDTFEQVCQKSAGAALNEKIKNHLQVIVHVEYEEFTFNSGAPVNAILTILEMRAGKGFLMRVADNFVPKADDQVSAGEYLFRSGELYTFIKRPYPNCLLKCNLHLMIQTRYLRECLPKW